MSKIDSRLNRSDFVVEVNTTLEKAGPEKLSIRK